MRKKCKTFVYSSPKQTKDDCVLFIHPLFYTYNVSPAKLGSIYIGKRLYYSFQVCLSNSSALFLLRSVGFYVV